MLAESLKAEATAWYLCWLFGKRTERVVAESKQARLSRYYKRSSEEFTPTPGTSPLSQRVKQCTRSHIRYGRQKDQGPHLLKLGFLFGALKKDRSGLFQGPQLAAEMT